MKECIRLVVLILMGTTTALGHPMMVRSVVNLNKQLHRRLLNTCRHHVWIMPVYHHVRIKNDRTVHMALIVIDHKSIDQRLSLVNRIYRRTHGLVSITGLVTSLSSFPIDMLLGKCVLIRDPSFQGCGFRMIEKDNYDTPIVVEVRGNSPAKRR